MGDDPSRLQAGELAAETRNYVGHGELVKRLSKPSHQTFRSALAFWRTLRNLRDPVVGAQWDTLPCVLWHDVPSGLAMETTTARKLHQYFQDWLRTAAATDQESIDLVEAGLSLKILERLLQRGLSRKELSAVIIRPRTLKHRRSRREPLSREESERAIRTGRVLARAQAVLGS